MECSYQSNLKTITIRMDIYMVNMVKNFLKLLAPYEPDSATKIPHEFSINDNFSNKNCIILT